MSEAVNYTTELNKVRYNSFDAITAKMRELSERYGDMPVPNLIAAFGMANRQGMYGAMMTNDPYIQNRRVKGIGSRPRKYSKNDVEKMLNEPSTSEQQLREVERSLEYTSYPLYHTRNVYQNLLTYHSYTAPFLINDGDSEKADFWREWKLLEKLREELRIRETAHMITGQTIQEGKVFYHPRISVDKAHNKINHAFLQQLPSDYTKIVGFNNKSKYTIAFNLMYFVQPGTDWRQFGSLFEPYIAAFNDSVFPAPRNVGSKLVYASKTRVRLDAVSDSGNIEAYSQNGKWFYWVTLPVDSVFTFEIDDAERNCVSPFTGLFIDMLQLSQLEQIQMELLQNPLVAVLTGEIPYFESKDINVADQYKLSNAGLELFKYYWYQMTESTNTGGIGVYAAPFKNMKLESLPESPSATNIVSAGYQDVINKAGLGGIIPTSSETRAGLAQISMAIEAQFPKRIYACAENMMNNIISSLNLKYDFRFHMFGDINTDEKAKEECRKDMTLGVLSSTIIFNALFDRSVFEDISWSEAIMNSKVLDKRIPLITSYSAKQETSGIPPMPGEDKGGRPETDGATSEGKEGDMDSPQADPGEYYGLQSANTEGSV